MVILENCLNNQPSRKQPKTLSGIETKKVSKVCGENLELFGRKQPKTLSGIETKKVTEVLKVEVEPKTT